MKRKLTIILAALCLVLSFAQKAAGQEYTSPKVEVSTEKVRFNGKLFYSHVVQERQTLYSICKAYNVTLQEVYDSNPNFNLATEGLKKDQIILIPCNSEAKTKEAETVTVSGGQDKTIAAQTDKTASQDGAQGEYFIHRVKWFEDLASIAEKYNVSKESIMNINGMTSEKIRRRDELKIPLRPENWEGDKAETTGTQVAETLTEEEAAPAEESEEGIFDKIFNKKKLESSVSLLLPFNASSKASGQMMDFYSGVLLAVDDLKNDGQTVELNVYDVAGGAMPVTEDRFASSDFVIGPVSNSDIARAVNASKGKTWIVSPLDPKAEALADTIPNIIQAPAPTSSQIGDMVEWIGSDSGRHDKVILITQKGVTPSGYSAEVANAVKNSGLTYSSISFNILEGRQMMGRISSLMPADGTSRVVIASDNKAFVIEVTRLLYLISSQKKDIVLYSTSKLRTFDEIEVEQLHKLNLHASVSYYVDYDSKAVQDFLMKYRALCGTEPSRSAFQGYDLMTFFTRMSSEYAGKLDRASSLKGSGLQSSFDLVKTSRGGYVNQAVRRIVYNADYTIDLAR
jgi:ABC-type branched-subunit amino acid transport system substrate-binding protein/type 1 fimbria pilin